MKKFFILVLPLFWLTACATAPEDLSRRVNFSWDINPETRSQQTLDVEQGEIFFAWKATAKATHSMYLNGKDVPLVLAETKYGNIFCTGGMKTDHCYEDRDGDARFDTIWNARPTSKRPIVVFSASNPESLDTAISFEAVTTKKIIAEQNLGVIFDGAVRGLLNEDGKFKFMIGSFQLGWHDGKDAPRDPTGLGWMPVNFMTNVYSSKKKISISVEELGVTYAITKAALDGEITLQFSAKKKINVALHKKLEIDLPDPEEEDPDTGKII